MKFDSCINELKNCYLNKVLKLIPAKDKYNEGTSDFVLKQDEFKILSYFYEKGYEIIYTADFRISKKYCFRFKAQK